MFLEVVKLEQEGFLILIFVFVIVNKNEVIVFVYGFVFGEYFYRMFVRYIIIINDVIGQNRVINICKIQFNFNLCFFEFSFMIFMIF